VNTNELAPAFHHRSLECPCVPCVQQNTRLACLLAGACQHLWLVRFDDAHGSSLVLGISSSLFLPDRIDARSLGNHLTAFSASQGCQDFVPAASDKTVTSFASAGSYCERKSQVWFMLFYVISNNHCNPIISHARVTPYFNKVLRLATISPMVARSPVRRVTRERATSSKNPANASLVLTALRTLLLRMLPRVLPPCCEANANRVANSRDRRLIVWLAVRRQGRSALCPSASTLTMLASPKTRWRLRIHAGSVTVVDEQVNASEP